MNEPVKAMIDKLHARLDDLAEVVEEIPFELNGYDKKLDRIDDQVYLIEVELEKKLKGAVPIAPVSADQSDAFDAAAATPARKGVAMPGASNEAQASQSTVHIVEEADENTTSKVTIEATHSSDAHPAGADAAVSTDTTSAPAEAKPAKDAEQEKEGFLTDSAKETIAGATKTLNTLYKEGKEVVGEFSEAFGDIKDVFGKNPFKKR